jgi:hypothetical protein
MKMALPDPIVQSCEISQAQQKLVMRKNIGESIETVSDMERRTEVDVEDERGANALRTGMTTPSAGGDRRRVERGDRHCPSRRPHGSLASGERS